MIKKFIIPIFIASCVFSFSITAIAAPLQSIPLDVSGDFRLRGYSINDKIGSNHFDDSYFQFIGRIHLTAQIADNTTMFARFAMRNRLGQSGSDNSTNKSYEQMDHYGIRTTQGKWNLSIGRQEVKLGQGLIIGIGDEVEYPNQFDGVVATTKAGAVDIKVIAGKTNTSQIMETYYGAKSSTWYGAEVSGKISPKVSMGLAVAHDKPEDSDTSRSSWALNTSVNVAPKLWMNAEYARSNANSDNSAYLIGPAYVAGKDVFIAQYQKVENNAVNQVNSYYSYSNLPFQGTNMWRGKSNWNGWFYKYTHQMNKSTSLCAMYVDAKVDGQSGRDKEGVIELSWGF